MLTHVVVSTRNHYKTTIYLYSGKFFICFKQNNFYFIDKKSEHHAFLLSSSISFRSQGKRSFLNLHIHYICVYVGSKKRSFSPWFRSGSRGGDIMVLLFYFLFTRKQLVLCFLLVLFLQTINKISHVPKYGIN